MTSYPTSKAQIDRLGDRLRREEESLGEADLRHLDAYRRSFANAYEVVIRTIEDVLHLQPTGRPGKSTRSIVDKLQRESIRLVQVQDIAGCRIVVADLYEQDRVLAALTTSFEKTTVFDRRENPSNGYRAVHVVASVSGKLVEIQIRTPLQHLWAEVSEKLSDVIEPSIKYGVCGDLPQIIDWLELLSERVADSENAEKVQADIKAVMSGLTTEELAGVLPQEMREQLAAWDKKVAGGRAYIRETLGGLLALLDEGDSSEEEA